ncbi:MAG: hypothetical protein EA385_00595, partial [Salinarimonadaceae bacterium]
RWPPFNQPPGTPWENGNPATGKRGSVIDSRAIDHSQAEIVNAIKRLGLTPDANNLEQLGLAIQNYVSSLTGEGGDDTFLTVPSARATLPIYPEVLSADGRLSISSPSSGSLVVAASGAIRHRGVFDVLLSDIPLEERTFAMLPSKVAHIRWEPTGGLKRLYLDDETYNPLGLPETDPSFDAGYDSAFLARATTDPSANVSITTLANRDRLESEQEAAGVAGVTTFNPAWGAKFSHTFALNWARTPLVSLWGISKQGSDTIYPDGWANLVEIQSKSRYAVAASVETNWSGSPVNPNGILRLTAHR